jgi:hypothetical protein
MFLRVRKSACSVYAVLACPCFIAEELKRYLAQQAIDNVTPADKYYGRDRVILKKREKVHKETMKMRRKVNRMAMLEPLPNGVSQIIMTDGIRCLGNQHASPKPPDKKQAGRCSIKSAIQYKVIGRVGTATIGSKSLAPFQAT